MTTDIFISYASQDSDFVTQLHQDLTARGFSVWFDQDNDNEALVHRLEVSQMIQASDVFLLVLSPDSVASAKVKYELSQAQGTYAKPTISLTWQTPANIPSSMQPRLALIEQRLDFAGEASIENFDELAKVLQRLTSPTKIAADFVVEEAQVQARGGERTGQAQTAGGTSGRRLGKPAIDPIAAGDLVISSVITPLDLSPADQDFVNGELKWLFSAVDNYLKIRHSVIDSSQSIAVSIPPGAQQLPEANNQLLLDNVEAIVKDWRPDSLAENIEYKLNEWQGHIETAIKNIRTHLQQLNILLEREVQLGEAGKFNIALQSQIQGLRFEIVKHLQRLAELMNNAYGILVTSPGQLVELLEVE